MLNSTASFHLPRSEAGGTTLGVQVDVGAFVMPNEDIDPDTPLKSFVVPLEALETVAGLKFFPKTLTAAKRQSLDAAARRWQHSGLLGTQVRCTQGATPHSIVCTFMSLHIKGGWVLSLLAGLQARPLSSLPAGPASEPSGAGMIARPSVSLARACCIRALHDLTMCRAVRRGRPRKVGPAPEESSTAVERFAGLHSSIFARGDVSSAQTDYHSACRQPTRAASLRQAGDCVRPSETRLVRRGQAETHFRQAEQRRTSAARIWHRSGSGLGSVLKRSRDARRGVIRNRSVQLLRHATRWRVAWHRPFSLARAIFTRQLRHRSEEPAGSGSMQWRSLHPKMQHRTGDQFCWGWDRC